MAVRRASNREAIGHFRQALALNEKLPPDIGRSRTELAILSQLGPALMSVHGWSAPEVGVVFERAENLARQLWRRHLRGCGCFLPHGVSSPVQMKSRTSCSISRVLWIIQIFSCRHITARGQFGGFVERLGMRRSMLPPDWASTTRFDMRGTAFFIWSTIRLYARCRLHQFYNGFWAIRSKQCSWNATRSIWRGAWSMYRRWLMHCGLLPRLRLHVGMLLKL